MTDSSSILITSGTTPFAQRIARSLLLNNPIRFGVSGEVPGSLLQTDKYIRIPEGSAPAFTHQLLKVCLDYGIDILIPLAENELLPLAQAAALFSEYHISVLLPPLELIGQFPLYADPDKSIKTVVFMEGNLLSSASVPSFTMEYSGVFAISDSGEEAALCCVTAP